MDYIREFDIKLDKEYYYAGEALNGTVLLHTVENIKLKGVRVNLRGRAHVEWKLIYSGERRTVQDDEYFIDEHQIVWGGTNNSTSLATSSIPILARGRHRFSFRFQLPETNLPCSFESRTGCIRYYVKCTMDIPYASPPQGTKYFTIIGPYIDCMEEQYLKPVVREDCRSTCCWCCKRGTISLRCCLERTAYVCRESVKLKAQIDNQSDSEVRLRVRLEQYCQFVIDRGMLGVNKDVRHLVFEYKGSTVKPLSRTKWDSANSLVLPPMPTTMPNTCKLIQISYSLTVSLDGTNNNETDKDIVHLTYPLIIATVPFRILNANKLPTIEYEPSCNHVEGGMYISPEFLLGQVYDGGTISEEGAQQQRNKDTIVLYKPVYVTVQNLLSG